MSKEKADKLLGGYVAALLGGAALGAPAGALAQSAVFEADQQSLPKHQRRLTNIEHAKNYGSWSEESARDQIMIKGLHQALMAETISPAVIDEMILSGEINPRVAFLLEDIYNFGATNPSIIKDPRYPQVIKNYRQSRQKNKEILGLE